MLGTLILNYVYADKKVPFSWSQSSTVEGIVDFVMRGGGRNPNTSEIDFYVCNKQGKILRYYIYLEDYFNTNEIDDVGQDEVYIVPHNKYLEMVVNIVNGYDIASTEFHDMKYTRDEEHVDTSPLLDEINSRVAELTNEVRDLNKSLERALKK